MDALIARGLMNPAGLQEPELPKTDGARDEADRSAAPAAGVAFAGGMGTALSRTRRAGTRS
jgi:hypothetical protein